MNLLIINRYFYPDITSVPQLLTELSKDLVRKNIDVSVICSRNSYNGNKKYKKYEEYKGIKIFRVGNIYGKNKGLVLRVLELITFFISVFFKSFSVKKTDVLFILSSPPMLAGIGFFIGKLKKAKIVYIIEDIHPEIEIELGMIKSSSLFSKIIRKYNGFILKRVDKIITLGKRMKENIINKYSTCPEKIRIISNWADGSRIYPLDKRENLYIEKYSLKNKFVVQYSGNMGLGHEFKTILEGIKRLQNEEDILFQFIGGGAKRKQIEDFVNKHTLTNVMLLPYQKYEYLNYSLNMADIALISIKEGLGGLLLPSKFYGIIASGKPFILVGDEENEIGDFIKKHRIGRFVPEGDIDGFINNIMVYYKNKGILKNEGKMARDVFMEEFDRKISIEKYYKLLTELRER